MNPSDVANVADAFKWISAILLAGMGLLWRQLLVERADRARENKEHDDAVEKLHQKNIDVWAKSLDFFARQAEKNNERKG
jgi:ABC-type nickel/cobalt efflux system permease component RcnA